MALHPHLDPELEDAARRSLRRVDDRDLTLEGIPDLRRRLEAIRAEARAGLAARPEVVSQDHLISREGGEPDLRVRVHRPSGQKGALGCFYHIHGGGMIVGSVDEEDPQMGELAEEVGCVVVSVDYRLAPEHPHPAPVEDCYAGLCWVSDNASHLQVDPARLAVGGESAGGGLAAATALLARDRGRPPLALQYLVYPMLDDRHITPSSLSFSYPWPGLTSERALLGWRALLGEAAGGEGVSPYAAPARADDLSGLPPAYVDVGSLDVFRDEDVDYARRLLRAEVAVELHVYPGVFHGWELAAPRAEVTARARANRFTALRRALAPG